jgi:hypothetical protein
MCIALPLSAASQRRRKAPKVERQIAQPQPVAQQQAVPVPPLTPEHGPSSPPEVMFQGGQLTIIARNSTMSDVLNAVGKRTGAAVEMPVVSSERVAGVFGPGAPRDVMAQLLNGSHYDYVLLGSPAEPGALKKVVLLTRPTGPEPAPPPQTAAAQMTTEENLQAVPDVEIDQSSEGVNTSLPPELPQSEQDETLGDQPQQIPANGTPVVKTPQQLLRELQQQQLQQQNGQPPQQR